MDINDLLVRRLLNEAPRGQDSSRIMALRLQQPQAPSGPLLDSGSVWAHALTQGLNGFRGGMMEAQADRRAEEREGRTIERVRQMDRERQAANVAALQGLNLPWMPRPAPPAPEADTAPPAPMGAPAETAALPSVAPRGEAPAPVAAGIAARRALDPNSPTYAEDIQRINNGVVAQTMPGARPQPVSTQAPGGAGSTPQVTVEQLSALAQLAATGNTQAQAQLQIAQALFNRQEQERARREARADAAANRQPQTVTTADGIFVLRPNGSLGTRLGDSPAQARPPATREERDDAVLFAPNADPNSPEYAQAYFRRFMTPRLTVIRGPNGEMMPSEVTVAPPPGLRAPAGFQAAPGQAASPQAGAIPAMATGMQPSGPIVSDTAPRPVAQAAPGMPNAAPAQTQSQAPGQGRALNINPLFSAERQTPAPNGFQWNADRTAVEPIRGGPQDPRTGALTEAQARANLFAAQMQMGNNLIDDLRTPSPAVLLAVRNAPETLTNMLINENDQQYLNAMRLFSAGILRTETGAAFTNPELLDVAARFFPMPGDSQAVIQQKARARAQAVSSMREVLPGGNLRGEIPGNQPRPQATLPGGQGVDPPSARQQPPISEGTTIINPQTGERLRLRDGQWVPVQ